MLLLSVTVRSEFTFYFFVYVFFFSSRRRHTRLVSDWSSDVCSSDLNNFTKQIASVFAAKRSGKDLSESIAKLEAAMKLLRSEERRVGKEGRSRGGAEYEKRKDT